MSYMDFLYSIAVPVALIVIVFSLPKLRRRLDKAAERAAMRSEFVEEFHENAMKFMKMTDPKRDENARDVVVFVGDAMMDGSRLIRAVVLSGATKSKILHAGTKDVHVLRGLNDDAKHTLGKVLALGLIVSSFQSLLFGGVYRSILSLMLSDDEKEVGQPERFVERIRHVGSFRAAA